MIGRTLSHYKVLEKIGEGGMGEVYLAKDTRLDRNVAVKVLPSHLADNPDLKQRFEREARAVSSLNHPHICTLHDIGEQDGTDFLVMEYIEGESLADRLKKGALPLDQALRHAIEIADALDKAHRQGVVHRDLKPGNIMLTKSGAKLLDFGLAKLKASEPGQETSALSALPTEEKPLTEKGSILGTFQYMAPEQLEGKDADARTDIFAFGAVLYEMVTGKRAFVGKSQAGLISAIMKDDPHSISKIQPLTPAALDHVVNTCLAKEPDERWQSAADLRRILLTTDEWSRAEEASPDSASRRHRRWLLGAAAVTTAAVLGVVLGSTLIIRTDEQRPQPVRRFSIQLPDGESLAPVGAAPLGVGRPALALSPDGSRLVYVGEHAGETQLYVRDLSEFNARPLSGTQGAYHPFFSPDGQWVGFFAGNEMKKITLAGGQPITLCEAQNTYGATWASDDIIYFAPQEGNEIQRISAAGGQPELVALPDHSKGILGMNWLEALPGGVGLLFSNADWTQPRVGLLSLESGEQSVLLHEGSDPTYLPTGHLVYSRPGGMMAVSFDLDKLQVTGSPVPILDGIRTEHSDVSQFTVSADGTLVYVPGQSMGVGRPVWVDRQGKAEVLPFRPEIFGSFRISPDGTRLVISTRRPTSHMWIYDFDRGGEPRRLSTEQGEIFPIWAPDGSRIAFQAEVSGQQNVFWRPADGSQERESLTTSENTQMPESWSPDARLLAVTETTPESLDIVVLDLETQQVRPFAATRFNEWGSAFSPDGRWIAYTSDESGQYEVYVQSYPPSDAKRQVSATEGGNEEPVWSRDGRELFYRNGRRWMAVSVSTDPTFAAEKPKLLFEGDYANVPGLSYDVSPEGKRFLLIQPLETSQPTELRVVLNWHQELLEKVPVQ